MVPAQVAGGHTDWTSVRPGTNHTCGRRAGGRAFCWGSDSAGQLGTSAVTTPEPRPVEVADGTFVGWGVPDGGDVHSCAIRGGHLYCWGSDYTGQLGDGPGFADSQTPRGGERRPRHLDEGLGRLAPHLRDPDLEAPVLLGPEHRRQDRSGDHQRLAGRPRGGRGLTRTRRLRVLTDDGGRHPVIP